MGEVPQRLSSWKATVLVMNTSTSWTCIWPKLWCFPICNQVFLLFKPNEVFVMLTLPSSWNLLNKVMPKPKCDENNKTIIQWKKRAFLRISIQVWVQVVVAILLLYKVMLQYLFLIFHTCCLTEETYARKHYLLESCVRFLSESCLTGSLQG